MNAPFLSFPSTVNYLGDYLHIHSHSASLFHCVMCLSILLPWEIATGVLGSRAGGGIHDHRFARALPDEISAVGVIQL